jgi:hypothetical protein
LIEVHVQPLCPAGAVGCAACLMAWRMRT